MNSALYGEPEEELRQKVAEVPKQEEKFVLEADDGQNKAEVVVDSVIAPAQSNDVKVGSHLKSADELTGFPLFPPCCTSQLSEF